jgi:hypothetical protein
MTVMSDELMTSFELINSASRVLGLPLEWRFIRIDSIFCLFFLYELIRVGWEPGSPTFGFRVINK